MGESKQRQLARAELLANKNCIFCGGDKAASQMDHVPPKIIFVSKDRPKGLEFPSCSVCNQGTRHIDQIVAFVSRITLDKFSIDEDKDFSRLRKAIKNNYPNLVNELQLKRMGAVERKRVKRQFPEVADIELEAGPIMTSALGKFGAKHGFALHYELTERIVPRQGAASVLWFTNKSVFSGEFPTEALKLFPPLQSIRQGLKNSKGQFDYASIVVNPNGTAHLVRFRTSFVMLILVAEDRELLSKVPDQSLHVPGDWILLPTP
jgi:hypothetical protein